MTDFTHPLTPLSRNSYSFYNLPVNVYQPYGYELPTEGTEQDSNNLLQPINPNPAETDNASPGCSRVSRMSNNYPVASVVGDRASKRSNSCDAAERLPSIPTPNLSANGPSQHMEKALSSSDLTQSFNLPRVHCGRLGSNWSNISFLHTNRGKLMMHINGIAPGDYMVSKSFGHGSNMTKPAPTKVYETTQGPTLQEIQMTSRPDVTRSAPKAVSSYVNPLANARSRGNFGALFGSSNGPSMPSFFV